VQARQSGMFLWLDHVADGLAVVVLGLWVIGLG